MPSDEELEAITGVNPFMEGAMLDRQLLDAYLEQGFSREEAMQLLVLIKSKTPNYNVNYDGGKYDG
jgi:hypothetical protein